MDANDAASYVQNLTGEDTNIIFGALYDDKEADYVRITVIATGLDDETARKPSVSRDKKTAKTEEAVQQPVQQTAHVETQQPAFKMPTSSSQLSEAIQVTSQVLCRRKIFRFRIS